MVRMIADVLFGEFSDFHRRFEMMEPAKRVAAMSVNERHPLLARLVEMHAGNAGFVVLFYAGVS